VFCLNDMCSFIAYCAGKKSVATVLLSSESAKQTQRSTAEAAGIFLKNVFF
jgi:hypothetical protein